MSIQSLRGEWTSDNRLGLSWIFLEDVHPCVGITVQVANDSEFTKGLHQYVLPPLTQACQLDTGNGVWYFRVGAMKGKTRTSGMVEWSGIPEPVLIVTPKAPEPLSKPFFKLLHTQSLTNGFRFHTDSSYSAYAFLQSTLQPNFLASATKTYFFEDPGRGYFDIPGMDPFQTYNLRITSTSTPLTFPTNTIHRLEQWIEVRGKKAMAAGKPFGGGDQASRKREEALLREANESRKPTRFSSSAEYTMFLAAKARTTDTPQS